MLSFRFNPSHPFPLLPFTFPALPLGIMLIVADSLLKPLDPGTLVLPAIPPFEYPVTVFQIFLVLTVVFPPVRPRKLPPSIHLIIFSIALINSPINPLIGAETADNVFGK